MSLVYRTRQRQNPYNVLSNDFVFIPLRPPPLTRQHAIRNRPRPTPTSVIMRQAINASKKIQTKQRQKQATKKTQSRRVANGAKKVVQAKSLKLPNNLTEHVLHYQSRPGQRRTTMIPLYRNTPQTLQNVKRVRSLKGLPGPLQNRVLFYLTQN